MTKELALPDPQHVAVAEVRDRVLPAVQSARLLIREQRDMAGARELQRRLAAFRRYLTDREGRNLIDAEARRTEVLIGYLLGPAPEPGTDVGRGRPLASLSSEANAVPRMDRHRFRLLAEYEQRVEELLSNGVVTRKAVLEAIQHGNGTPTPLPDGQFATITADPPWRYGNTATRAAAQGHYKTLSVAQLAGEELMPDGRNLVKDVVEPRTADRAHLYLWTTSSHLPDAFGVMEAWGFAYKTYLVWVKPQMGMGNYFRVSTELVLFGVKGDMRTQDMGLVNWFESRRGKHSAKPARFYDLVNKASIGPYLEMFGRCDAGNQLTGTCQCSRCRLGWQIWGDEA